MSCRKKAKNILVTVLTVGFCTTLLADIGTTASAADVNGEQVIALDLSAEEKLYLQRKTVVKMCIDPDWMPYERINEQGAHEGMSADYMALFQQRIGIPIRLVPTSSWSETLQFGRERRCDILSLLNESPERSEFLNFTPPYVEAPIVLVTRDDVTFLEGISSLGDRTISTPKGYIYEERIKNDYPKINLVTVPTVTDGLMRVSRGEIFTHLGSLYVVVNQLQEHQLSNLKVSGHTEYVHNLAVGVRNDDPLLLAVFDKAVRSITPQEHIEIRRKWTATKIEHGADYTLVQMIIVGGLVLLGVVLMWNRKLARLNARVQESEAEYRAIFEASKVGLAMCKMDGTLVECNQAYLDIIGYSEKEALELTYWDVTPRTFEDDEAKQLRSLEETGGYGPYEKHYINKSGEKVPVLLNGTLLKGADGNDYIWSIVQDITDRKYIEIQRQLALEAAERANNSKSEFLASMSHELRTPLNAVLGFAQMLQFDSMNPLTSVQKDHVESILAGGGHLLELINEVLDLARIEADQVDLSLSDVAANAVVSDCVALTVPLGETRGIKILNTFSSGAIAHLRTDQLRLKQILLNLLSNAVKYNMDGGTVTVDGRETEGGFLRLSVMDTGIGIPEADYSRIFHMFQRLGADPMIAREGTGIGLTVTKLLVERMAGRIGFDSAEGVGSTFWIELPLTSNAEVIIWTDALRVGVDAIDKDHQAIISHMNSVSHLSVGDRRLDTLIDELIDYTHYHFRREEVVMEACGYPDFEEHRAHHQELDAQVGDLAAKWRKNRDPEMLHHLSKFLREWWTGHIMKVDTEIAKYAKGKGQEIRQALDRLE